MTDMVLGYNFGGLALNHSGVKVAIDPPEQTTL